MSTDKEFLEQLEDYLGYSVPLFYNKDATINREKTLSLPCFADFKEKNEHQS